MKDVIEPLENVSVNLFPTNKQDISEFGPPQQVSISNQDEDIKFVSDFSMFELSSVRGKDFSVYSMMTGCRNFNKKGSGSC